MPWTVDDVAKHNGKLGPKGKSLWVKVANQSLADGDDDAAAIRKANAAAGRIKESEGMLEKVLESLREAAKVLHLDKSHSALRDKLQTAVSTKHAIDNPDSPYYDHPYVHDVYGDEESGTVVHGRNGKMMASKFQKGKDGSYTLSKHTPVKRAYVSDNDADDTKESLLLVIDAYGATPIQESSAEVEENLDLCESAFSKDGHGRIRLIAPGHGSTGYYSPEVLKQAAKDKVFPAGTHMHIDHQTEQEESDRPEGSIKTLAAKTTSDAQWMDKGPVGPGLYADAKAYSDFVPFLNERAKDIGVSIRAVGTGRQGEVGGRVNNIVSKLVASKSVDFVTRAGAGGKLVPLLESFRASSPEKRQPAARRESNMAEINDQELAALKESAAKVPGLTLQIQRNNEQLARISAKEIASEMLSESGLPAPAQKRVLRFLAGPDATLPLDTNGALDTVKFKESVKKAAQEEDTYLKETAGTVRSPGVEPSADDIKKFNESMKSVDDELDSLVGSLSGVKKEKK